MLRKLLLKLYPELNKADQELPLALWKIDNLSREIEGLRELNANAKAQQRAAEKQSVVDDADAVKMQADIERILDRERFARMRRLRTKGVDAGLKLVKATWPEGMDPSGFNDFGAVIDFYLDTAVSEKKRSLREAINTFLFLPRDAHNFGGLVDVLKSKENFQKRLRPARRADEHGSDREGC